MLPLIVCTSVVGHANELARVHSECMCFLNGARPDLVTNYHVRFKPTTSRHIQTASQPADTTIYATMQEEIGDNQDEIADSQLPAPGSPEVVVVLENELSAFFDELNVEATMAATEETETQPASDQDAASHAAPVGESLYATLLAHVGLDKSDDEDDCPETLVVIDGEAVAAGELIAGGEDSLVVDPYSASSLAEDTAPKAFVRLPCVPIVAPNFQGQWQPLGRYVH
jgi:hypothetical protein